MAVPYAALASSLRAPPPPPRPRARPALRPTPLPQCEQALRPRGGRGRVLARASGGRNDTEKALDRILGDDGEGAEGTRAPDPFAPMSPEEVAGQEGREGERTAAEGGAGPERGAGGAGGEFGGKRVYKSEMEEFLDISNRFEGLFVLIDGLKRGGLGASASLRPGQLVVLRNNIPALYLWKFQAYEIMEVYFQRRNDELGRSRRPCDSLADAPPPDIDGGSGKEWEMWVSLYSEEYHSSPVRCKAADLEINSVGEEVIDSLKIALPILAFWVAVSVAFLRTSKGM